MRFRLSVRHHFIWLCAIVLSSAGFGLCKRGTVAAGKMPGLPHPLGNEFWFPDTCHSSVPRNKKYKTFVAKKRPPGWKNAESLRDGKVLLQSWTHLLQGNRLCTFLTEDCCKTDVAYSRVSTPKSKRGCQNLPKFSPSNSTCAEAYKLHLRSWGTCAFVSQGSTLLRREHGNEIDNHTTVIRLGHMPLRGWEPFTGRRTDVLLGRGSIQSKHAGDYKEVRYVIGSDRTKISKNNAMQLQISNTLHVKPQSHFLGGIQVLLHDPNVMQHLYCVMTSPVGRKPRGPSSGISALMTIISSQLCEHIDVYGMSADCGGYYHNRKYAMKLHHSCELESWVLHELMKSHYSLARACVWI